MINRNRYFHITDIAMIFSAITGTEYSDGNVINLIYRDGSVVESRAI